MAIGNLGADSVPANITLKDIRHAARSLRRLNEIQAAPVLSVEDRIQVTEAKALCWTVVGSVTEALVSLMDAIAGDPDLEDATDAEDEGLSPLAKAACGDTPGCPSSDHGGGNVEDEGEAIDEREPDHDAEVETWSHWLDHPAELHIVKRAGWNDEPPEAA